MNVRSSTVAPPPNLAQRLDRVPISGFHRKLVVVSGLGWMFDAMDILILGGILAAIGTAWKLELTTITLISSVNLFGMFVGASVAGALSDRFGRRTVFQSTLLIYSICTGLSALAWNTGSLMALRFLAGLGLGGELPVASTLVSEFAPARQRGVMVVLLESFWAFGSVLAALIGYLVIPNFGWQAAFLIGALPALYVFILRRAIPESPRFLLTQGRAMEAEKIVLEVERSAGMAEQRVRATPRKVRRARAIALPRPKTEGWSWRTLLTPLYLRRTLVLWVLWATMNFSYYGIFLWLPSQFVRKGFSLEEALLFNLIVSLAQIPGYFVAAWLVEHWGRRYTLAAFLAICALGAWMFSQATLAPQLGPEAVPSILIWGSVISFFNLGAWGVVYTYTPELYPTAVRGAGTGAAAAFGRLWAILAPLSIPLQIGIFGAEANVFIAFIAIMLVGAVVMLAFGIETRGRSLEELAEAPA